MSVKLLLPGAHPRPALVAVTDAAVLLHQLLSCGWARYGERPATAAAGELVIGADRVRLVVDGEALLDDVNPATPNGWWTAVDEHDSHCIVVIAQQTDADLTSHRPHAFFAELRRTGGAVSATLPVLTSFLDSI